MPDRFNMERVADHARRLWMDILLWTGFAVVSIPMFRLIYTTHWQNLDYDHAYFILPISLFLVWRQRRLIREVERGQAKWISSGFLLVFVLFFYIYLFGWKWRYMFLCVSAFIPAAAAITGYIYGYRVLGKIWFAFFYLIFMIPPPISILDHITLPMRYISADVAYKMLEAAGYHMSKAGLILTINDYSIIVGNACSGFRSFITLLSLGVLYIHLFASRERILYKTVLLGLIPVLAILGNSLRISVIGVIGLKFGHEVADSFLHSFSGMVVFVFMICGLLLADRVMSRFWAATKQKNG